jgi:hypothetical protein
MYVCFADRSVFQLLLEPGQRAAEVGVYKGEYSQGLLSRAPAELFLIDTWTAPDNTQRLPSDCHLDAETQINAAISDYYPGGVALALQQAEKEVTERFSAHSHVKILRMTSKDAVPHFADHSLDFVYIDANHRFDFVLSDLIRWSQKVKPSGYLVLNDFYASHRGALQFLSVMEAASQFIKLYDWAPLAMNTSAFSDLVLVRKDALLATTHNISAPSRQIFALLIGNNIPFIEVANNLVHAAMHKKLSVNGGDFEFLSFA